MTDIERIFREGLAKAAESAPRHDPIDVDEVIAQSRATGVGASNHRSLTRGLLIAAAVVLIAGLGLGSWLAFAPGPKPQVLVAAPADPTSPSATPSTPLIGTVWRLSEIDNQPVVLDTGGRGPELTFQKSTVTGTDGCNTLGGSYRLEGDRLKLTDLMSTLVGCSQSDALAKQQAAYGENLNRSGRLTIQGSTLTLFAASGTPILIFQGRAGPTPEASTPATTVQIRVENGSSSTMDDVEITFADGNRVAYGSIAPGQRTSYKPAGRAYRYAYVRATVDGKERILQPIDYVGETALAPGRYTYVLTVSDGSLGLEFVTDE